jgi:uncharacterized protein (UPF0264 family)
VKVLISVVDEEEAAEAIAGGADIIDVKNPKEGALGANFPWVIKRIRKITPKKIEVSCTLGDMPNLPGATSLAATGAATTGVNYVKAGLSELKSKDDAVFLMLNVVRAVRECNPTVKIAAVGYADAERIGSINPLLVPDIAYKAEADFAMLDTAVKNGNSLFTFLTTDRLKRFMSKSRDRGLKVALAGALKKEDLPAVYALDADVVGLRSVACTGGDRIKGRITKRNVEELVEIVRRLEKHNEIKI